MRLLVATDFSPQTDNVLGVARRLARAMQASVTVLHVVSPRAARNGDTDTTEEYRLTREAAAALREAGIEAEGVVARVVPGRRHDDAGPGAGIRIKKMDGMSRVLLASVARAFPLVRPSSRRRQDYAGAVARIGSR